MSETKNEFVHLNVHTVYSLHESVCKIAPLVKKARRLGMKALAITDSGNMFGAMEFHETCLKTTGEFEGLPQIKPIVGCEVAVAVWGCREKALSEKHDLRLRGVQGGASQVGGNASAQKHEVSHPVRSDSERRRGERSLRRMQGDSLRGHEKKNDLSVRP